jgi:hypothetical protein
MNPIVPRTEAGTDSLTRENRTPAGAGKAEALQPPAAPRPTPEERRPVPRAQTSEGDGDAPADRRGGERRQNDRRSRNVPVLLDTRSGRDRRTSQPRRRTDRSSDAARPRGIDDFA